MVKIKLAWKGAFSTNMTLKDAKNISIGSIDVMSDQLINSLTNLKSLAENLKPGGKE